MRKVLKGAEPLATNMHQAWVSFIKTGSPNVNNNGAWKTYSDNDRQIMVFDMPNPTPRKLTDVFNDPAFPNSAFILH